MYSNSGIQRYHETNINSISREKMIVLLYEKIISDLSQASEAIKQNDRVEMNKKVNHSLRIVTELRNALDHSIGGDISRNLESLYDFLFNEQLELLVDQDVVHVDNCTQILQPLLEAWSSIPTGTAQKTETERVQNTKNQDVGTKSAHEKLLAVEKARSQGSSQPETTPPPATKQPLVSVSA